RLQGRSLVPRPLWPFVILVSSFLIRPPMPSSAHGRRGRGARPRRACRSGLPYNAGAMGVLQNKSVGLAVLLMLAVASGAMGAAPEADDVTAARDAFQRWWYQATDKFPERRLVLALSAIPPEEREADDWFWLSQASHRGYEIEVESPDPRLRPDQALGREAVLRGSGVALALFAE